MLEFTNELLFNEFNISTNTKQKPNIWNIINIYTKRQRPN